MICITCSCVWLSKINLLFLVIRMYSTVHVLLSESLLKLLPSESESFTISLFYQFWQTFLWSIFCTRTCSGVFHIACGEQNISWLVKPHLSFRSACYWDRQSDLLHMKMWVSCHKTEVCIESNVKTVCYATVHSWQSSIPTYMPWWNTNRVTETTSMGESNGTNLKPIPSILF
jgi:hypothetical protein